MVQSKWAIIVLTLAPSIPLLAQTPATVRVFGYVQPRFEATRDTAVFLLRRARLGAQGTVLSWGAYRVQGELRGGDSAAATVELTDAWVAVVSGRLTATFGQFKTPFSRELLQPASTLELSERTVAVSEIAPSRDVGAMVDWNRGGVRVQGGVFNGEGANHAANPDKHMLYVGRVVAVSGTVELAGNAAADQRGTRWGADGQLRAGRWIARGEYLTFVHTGGGSDQGWYAFAAYMVKGDRIQLVSRAEEFEAIHGYTLGGQYLFSGDDLKLQADYTQFRDGAGSNDHRFVVQIQARF